MTHHLNKNFHSEKSDQASLNLELYLGLGICILQAITQLANDKSGSDCPLKQWFVMKQYMHHLGLSRWTHTQLIIVHMRALHIVDNMCRLYKSIKNYKCTTTRSYGGRGLTTLLWKISTFFFITSKWNIIRAYNFITSSELSFDTKISIVIKDKWGMMLLNRSLTTKQ